MNTRHASHVGRALTGRGRWLILLGAVAGLLLVGGIPGNMLPVTSALADQQETGIEARRLQLEGTQLQLKGDLKGALEKYRQSLALKPNERLEKLVQRLEKQAQKKGIIVSEGQEKNGSEETSTEPEIGAEPARATGQLNEPGEGVAPGGQMAGPAPAGEEQAGPAPVQHHPASPEEALVYEFVDWALENLSALAQQGDMTLATNRNYTTTRDGNGFTVSLDPFALVVDEGVDKKVNLGPLKVVCQPKGADLLDVRISLPERIGFVQAGKESFAFVYGDQNFTLSWDRRDKSFPNTDFKLTDLAADFSRSGSAEDQSKVFKVALLAFNSALTGDEGGTWTEKLQGDLKGFLIKDTDFSVSVDKIGFKAKGSGGDLENYRNLKAQYNRLAEIGDDVELKDLKEVSRLLDRYLQLLIDSNGTITLDGIKVDADGVMTIGHADINGTMVRKKENGQFDFAGKGVLRDFTFTENAPENPVKVTLKEITLTDGFRINPIRDGLFSQLYDRLAEAERTEDPQAQDKLISTLVLEYGKEFLSLIGAGNTEMSMNDFQLINAMPQPVTLGKASMGAGFDTGTGSGGTLDVSLSFSDFTGMDEGMGNIPQAASLKIKLDRIPSLLNLIDNPEALMEGNDDQLQGQMMMNGMNALMSSGLNLSLVDTFVAFADARLDLGLKAKVDPNSPYMATGDMQISVENPDTFSDIVASLGEPQLQQFLATLTALANRTETGGKTVDRIDARLTADGKIMVNNKDVTAMFIPQAAPAAQDPAVGGKPEQAPQQEPVEPSPAQ